MSENVREMVEDPHAHQGIKTARSLVDATDAGESLQGYAAVNDRGGDSEIARLAYQYYEQRQNQGADGSAESDWLRAEQEIRRLRESGDL